MAQPVSSQPGRENDRRVVGGQRNTDPAAEGRRKFQRTGGTDTRRKSSAPNVTSAPRLAAQDSPIKTSASFRGRRQSVREHKVPLGPRPYEKQR